MALAEERRITAQLLPFLREVERRRLFAQLGYGSLYEYVIRELGHSEASAHRRISSMRLLVEMPEVEEKIKDGTLTLSNVAQAQQFFRNETKHAQPLNIEQKREVLQSLEGKSSREAERELVSRSSFPLQFAQKDVVKPVAPTFSHVSFLASQELLDQLEQVKGLLAHARGSLNLADLISEMAKIAIERLQAKKFAQTKGSLSTSGAGGERLADGAKKLSDVGGKNLETKSEVRSRPETEKIAATTEDPTASSELQMQIPFGTTQKSRYIPAEIKRAVFRRDQGRCTYVNTQTGRRCNSVFALEFDHLRPFGQGGETSVANLATRCRSHNQAHAIQSYGVQAMEKFLR